MRMCADKGVMFGQLARAATRSADHASALQVWAAGRRCVRNPALTRSKHVCVSLNIASAANPQDALDAVAAELSADVLADESLASRCAPLTFTVYLLGQQQDGRAGRAGRASTHSCNVPSLSQLLRQQLGGPCAGVAPSTASVACNCRTQELRSMWSNSIEHLAAEPFQLEHCVSPSGGAHAHTNREPPCTSLGRT